MNGSGEPAAVAVAMGCDEAFAHGLVALGRSLIAHRPHGRPLELYVFDAGLEPSTRARIDASWEEPATTVHWLTLDSAVMSRCGLGFLATRSAMCVTLVLDLLLPPHLERVLYLDADMLVLSNLAPLWDTDLGGHTAAAVRDTMIPAIGDTTLPGEYRALAEHPNFNAGLLLVDLVKWRRDGVGQAARDCAARYDGSLWSVDQQILNWLLVDRWRPLPTAWNRMTHLRFIPSHEETCVSREEFEEARRAPRIAHFAGGVKPWRVGCPDDRAREFAAVMQQTAWAPWQPASAGFLGQLFIDVVREPHRRYQIVRRGLKIARNHGLPRRRWWFVGARIAARYPWTAVTFPITRAVARARRVWSRAGPQAGSAQSPADSDPA